MKQLLNWFRGSSSTPRVPRRRYGFVRPVLEPLERRQLLSVTILKNALGQGEIFTLNANGTLTENTSTGSHQVAANVKSIAGGVDRAGHKAVFVLENDGTLNEFVGNSWTNLDHFVSAISVGPTGLQETFTVLGHKWVGLGRPQLQSFGVQSAADGGHYLTRFDGWVIYQASGGTTATLLDQAVFSLWKGRGGSKGVLGAPVSDETQVGRDTRTTFQNGTIVWDSAGGHVHLTSSNAYTQPTVAFTPHFGNETISPNNHYGMQSPKVYFIFSGAYWGTHPTDVSTLLASAKNILGSSYLSGVTQYGSDGKAIFGGSWIDTRAVPMNDTSYNPAEATVRDVQSFLQTSIAAHPGAAPGSGDLVHTPIYVVISDPSWSPVTPMTVAYNTQGTYQTNQLTHMIWVGTALFGNGIWKDGFTLDLSHELAETYSDPDGPGGAGINVTPPANLPASLVGDQQIADNEPAIRYGYRINGDLVQAYWSNSTKDYIVPGDKTQTVTLTPIWNGSTFTDTYDLQVTGDQLGANFGDNIRVDAAANGGLVVTINNDVVAFDAGEIRNLSINTMGGSNFVQVANVPAGVTVNINSQGKSSDDVWIGSDSDSLAGIHGTINVRNTSGQTDLTVDALNDGANTFTITNHSVSTGNATINYTGGVTVSGGSVDGVTMLDVIDGKGKNTVQVNSLAALTHTTIWADVLDLFQGTAGSLLDVRRTHS